MKLTSFYTNHRTAYKVLLAILVNISMALSVSLSMFVEAGEDALNWGSAHTESRPLLQEGAPPLVTLDVPGEVIIGGEVTCNVIFDNTALVEGYGPVIDLILPTNGADGWGAAGWVKVII